VNFEILAGKVRCMVFHTERLDSAASKSLQVKYFANVSKVFENLLECF
jgi:hypothetical protein